MLTFAIPCLFGLEGLVGDEVRRLGLAGVRVENGRVLGQGEAGDIPRLNLNLRCGERVLVELAAGPVHSFEALYQLAAGAPWEAFIPREGQFPVKGHALDSQLHSVPDCQRIVKKAAARRLGHTALHALSLPTVWAPETAGEALARTVQAILQEREGTI